MARRDRIVVNKDNASTGGVVGWTQRISVFYKLFQIYKLFNKRGGWRGCKKCQIIKRGSWNKRYLTFSILPLWSDPIDDTIQILGECEIITPESIQTIFEIMMLQSALFYSYHLCGPLISNIEVQSSTLLHQM